MGKECETMLVESSHFLWAKVLFWFICVSFLTVYDTRSFLAVFTPASVNIQYMTVMWHYIKFIHKHKIFRLLNKKATTFASHWCFRNTTCKCFSVCVTHQYHPCESSKLSCNKVSHVYANVSLWHFFLFASFIL